MRRYGIRIQWLFGYDAGFAFVFPLTFYTKKARAICVAFGPAREPGGRAPAGAQGIPGPATQIRTYFQTSFKLKTYLRYSVR